MKKILLGVFILFLALGCTSKPPKPTFDPIADVNQEPLEPIQDDDGNVFDDGSGSESLLADGSLNPVFFEYDSFDIGQAQMPVLQSNAKVAKEKALSRIRIEGHCDERGTEEYNLALGDRRARAAKEYLVSLGLNPNKLYTLSYGESRPFEMGHGENAWSSNRRAHFVSE